MPNDDDNNLWKSSLFFPPFPKPFLMFPIYREAAFHRIDPHLGGSSPFSS